MQTNTQTHKHTQKRKRKQKQKHTYTRRHNTSTVVMKRFSQPPRGGRRKTRATARTWNVRTENIRQRLLGECRKNAGTTGQHGAYRHNSNDDTRRQARGTGYNRKKMEAKSDSLSSFIGIPRCVTIACGSFVDVAFFVSLYS